MSQRKAAMHKYTVYCSINGCKYTSRQWVVPGYYKEVQKNSVFSTKCPKHQTELISDRN